MEKKAGKRERTTMMTMSKRNSAESTLKTHGDAFHCKSSSRERT
jgi:hypothetical protein